MSTLKGFIVLNNSHTKYYIVFRDCKYLHIKLFSVSNSTNVMVTTLNEQIVGQPLMLECAMSTPRGITSRVDVVWSRDGVEVEHINDISSNFSSPEVVVYTNIYTIPLLGTYDDDIVYECEVIINSSPKFEITDSINLDVTGMNILIFNLCLVIYANSILSQFLSLLSQYHHLLLYKEQW